MRKGQKALVTPLLVTFSLLVATMMNSALAQDLGFSNASLNGTYAWVRIGAGPEGPNPNYARWTLVNYNGDGTWDTSTGGQNIPGEPDADGNPTRQAEVLNEHFEGTYELTSNGMYKLWFPDGTLGFHGVVLQSEMIDDVPVVTEFVVFSTSPDEDTGGLHTGHKWRMNPTLTAPQ